MRTTIAEPIMGANIVWTFKLVGFITDGSQ